MKTLTLKNRFQGNSTLIENDFIDSYMIKANGEYVKVYLYLLRHLGNPDISLTISGIADHLENTEKDILRALKHWEKSGLLFLEYDEAGKIIGLELGAASERPNVEPLKTQSKVEPVKVEPVKAEPLKPAVSKENAAKERRAFKQLLFIAEQYLGKTLSKTEMDTITYFFDDLHFSVDLIEYLIEHCVEHNHKSIHYIKSVALAWSDAHITTVTQARHSTSAYNKNCYSVLKAFGILGRGPAATELDYIKKWVEEYAFSLDVIIEACNRTIASTHQPSFEYADSILKSWLKNEVHHLSDVLRLDETFKKEKTKKAPVPTKSASTNKFNNFQGRTYDIDSLEEQLLKQ